EVTETRRIRRQEPRCPLRREQRGFVEIASLPVACCYCRLNLCLHLLQIEARALLHWRKLHKALGCLCTLLLREDTPPRLEHEPVVIGERSGVGFRQSSALIRI